MIRSQLLWRLRARTRISWQRLRCPTPAASYRAEPFKPIRAPQPAPAISGIGPFSPPGRVAVSFNTRVTGGGRWPSLVWTCHFAESISRMLWAMAISPQSGCLLAYLNDSHQRNSTGAESKGIVHAYFSQANLALYSPYACP